MNHSRPNPFGDSGKRQLVVVQNFLQECPYLDETARMPLEMSLGTLDHDDVDELLELGYRRSGEFLYRTKCPTCTQCKPTRVLVDEFVATKSMRRVENRGDQELVCEWGKPQNDEARVAMFNNHRAAQHLGRGDKIDEGGYESFLTSTCFQTLELAIYHKQELAAISIFDVGTTSFSAVYTHFFPEFSKFSLGTYAILKQIRRARQTERPFVYLGMYVSGNRHLNYKARYLPQERLIDGVWTRFETPQP